MGLYDKAVELAEQDEKKIDARKEDFRLYIDERKAKMDAGGVPEEKRPV